MKPLIIGQAPSRTSDPSEPLSGRSGARLALLCGCELPAFLEAFDRRNMLDYWPGHTSSKADGFMPVEKARALAKIFKAQVKGRKVILLGNHVAQAFDMRNQKSRTPYPLFSFIEHWDAEFAYSPHPSGASRWWNSATNVDRACRFWRGVYASISA